MSVPRIDKVIDTARAEAAHQECPYSKATRGNIDVVTVVRADPVASVA